MHTIHKSALVPKNEKSRPLRVAALLQEALVKVLPDIVQWQEDLKKSSFAITHVKMSPDLRTATLSIACYGTSESGIVLTILKKIAPYIQKKVAACVILKFMPKLKFIVDTQSKKEEEMHKIFAAIAKDLQDDT